MSNPVEPTQRLVPVDVMIDQLNKLNQAIHACAGTTGDWRAVVLRDQTSLLTVVAAEYQKAGGLYPRLSKVLPDQVQLDAYFSRRMVELGYMDNAELELKIIDKQGKPFSHAEKTFDELCYEAAALDEDLQVINKKLGLDTHGETT